MEYVGIIEHEESVIYIHKDGDNLTAGTLCNSGIIPHHEMKIDHCFSLDENLQYFIEGIQDGNI